MSIVLFWSPLHGQGQTSNLHATAFVMSLLYKKSVLMMQTHFDKNNLESPLVGQNVDKRNDIDNPLFQDIGLDMAVTYSNMNKLSRKILESCCITFPNTSLLLLPGTEVKNKETFVRDIGSSVGRMILDANECVDIILIDSNSGDDELSFKLMQMADLTVVNLTQRKYVLDKFFSDYGDRFIDNKKTFYLFGDYDDNSSYNINNCRRRFKNYMNGKNSGVIPYCTQYMDAQNEGTVFQFLKEGLFKNEQSYSNRFINAMKGIIFSNKYLPEETEYFFHRTRLSAEKIIDLLHIPFKRQLEEDMSK